MAATEGTLWLLDEARQYLVPVWNSGPAADRFVGSFVQPLSSGLISLVCITELALCENAVDQNGRQDPTLDRQLGLKTEAMIAVPLYFHDQLRGIISCVKLHDTRGGVIISQTSFSGSDLALVGKTASTLNENISNGYFDN